MIPLIPAIALALFSFICSAFVILRIVIPILPPHPLSKRVSPAEFGLPKFRSLSPADKSHIWLASLDLLALSIFVWQTINEAVGGPSDYTNASDPGSAVRLWFVMTIRQICLLVVASITLLHVRMGRSVSFGAKHWMLWAPTLLLAITSTTIAGVISGTGVRTLFIGIIGFTSIIAVLSSVAFACLIITLVIIKRNLAALNEDSDPWPPVRLMEEKPRPSFATEEIDAIRDGASWITSNASSRQNSISGWSFSTHQTGLASSHHGHGRPQTGSHPSVPAKSSFWFNSSTPNVDDVPPVPPLPSPYGPLSPTAECLSDPDPFRRDTPSPLPDQPRVRLGSQTSWLTSTNGSHTTMSAWSYPASVREGTIRNVSTPDLHTGLTAVSRPVTPQLANAQVLGGYGYAPGSLEAEKGLATLAAPPGTTLDVSMIRLLGWLIIIWVPMALSLPYLIAVSHKSQASTLISILLVLSITMSSPLLALTILFRSPIPIPSGLFDIRGDPPANVLRGPSPASTDAPYKWSHDYKRSMSTSVTVVEGRRSGDVWLTNGDAVDGKSKMSRAVGMLNPMPKLSVLPPEELEDGEFTPPLPIQNEDSSLPVTIHNTPHSETSAQFGRLRKDSKTSSHLSAADESLAFASRIMIAQRHYSTLAQTVVVPGSSPEKQQSGDPDVILGSASGATNAKAARHSAHLRTRSVSSISGPQTPTTGDSFNISPPPSFPLPPTPPNVRAARLASLAHKKSFSSGFSFGAVDDMNEIDALTAGVLPLLVPGINMGGMKIKEGEWTPPGTFSKSKGKKLAKRLNEFGEDFSSPEVHSTPARRRPKEVRARKTSAHRRNHFSLPSLGLGKDGVHSLSTWSADVRGALEHKVGQYTATPGNVDLSRRNTVFGGDSVPNMISNLQVVHEHEDRVPMASKSTAGLGRAMSTRSLGLRAEVPHGVDTARSSVASLVQPTSAASTVTLFEEFAAGLESGPQAESTPHNTISIKPSSRHAAPPMPKQSRRSSIVYIKSDDHVSPTNAIVEPTTSTSAMSTFAQWSTRAVRPLIPKASKLQRKMSNADSSQSGKKPGSPGGNLRSLTLLQDRNTNTASPVLSETRPLTLGKRQKARGPASVQDENAYPDSSSRNKNLKPLKLARSDTNKLRGLLRKEEVLPDVVVRPPSTTDHTGFAYSFNRD